MYQMMPDKIQTDFYYMFHRAMVINSGNNPNSSEEY